MFAGTKFAEVIICAVAALTVIQAAGAAEAELSLALDNAAQVEVRNVSVRGVDYRGGPALEVRRLVSGAAPDIDTFAFLPGFDFHNGTIEVEVAGSPLPAARRTSRRPRLRRGGISGPDYRRIVCLRRHLPAPDKRARGRPSPAQPFDAVFRIPGLRFRPPPSRGAGAVRVLRRLDPGRMDCHAHRGTRHHRKAICRRGPATSFNRQRSQARSGRTRQRWALCRQRYRRAFSEAARPADVVTRWKLIVPESGFGTSRHFAAIRNLVRYRNIADRGGPSAPQFYGFTA